MKNKYYLTTAIAYVNANPHIGFALELLYSDVMARYQRLLGKDVHFLTGTDEHGQKILKSAKENSQSVEDFVAEKSAIYSNLVDQWNISNDDFIRTTETRHMKSAQEFWKKSLANGDIYKKSYTGLYCVGCESFKLETDLVDGKCPDHLKAPEELSEENYFFKLSKYQKDIESLFEKNPEFVYPEHRFKEMKNMLKNGLDDVSISRVKDKLPWGIPVPDDETQVMYVWFDALTNYITALGWGSDDEKLFKKFWPVDAHVIGKEINRFHSLLWPAMLMSAGVELPKQIAVHGWITVDGQKMSKSIGNVVDPIELVQKYPIEAVRYFLMREIQFDNDGDFSYTKFNQRYEADLANGLGNLTNRILVMIEKYCDGIIPGLSSPLGQFRNEARNKINPYNIHMAKFSFSFALEIIWELITYCDLEITKNQPWSMMKIGKETDVKNLLCHLAESLRHIAVMIWPIMPGTSEKLFTQLGLEISGELSKPISELLIWGETLTGNKIAKPEQLFPRLNN